MMNRLLKAAVAGVIFFFAVFAFIFLMSTVACLIIGANLEKVLPYAFKHSLIGGGFVGFIAACLYSSGGLRNK